MTNNVVDLLKVRAERARVAKARDDGSCSVCGRARVVCQPGGVPCLFGEER